MHLSSCKNITTHIAHYNTFLLLRYAYFRYAKYFTNIQKQQNTLKTSLLFLKKQTLRAITREILGFRMRNFQDMNFI